MAKRVELGQVGEFPAGKLTNKNIEGKNILVYVSNDGICAVENRCPHWGVPMTNGKVIEGADGPQVQCPLHNSKFDLCSGKNTEWVTGFGGTKLPGFMTGLMKIGNRDPQDIAAYPVEEEDGKLFIMLADEEAQAEA
jgi:nitrite reductase/ring-hydroxylating ferredoxin subunit